MSEKYLSIITNFGCHGKCPYCITKTNNIAVPKTTIDGLKNLYGYLHPVKKYNIVSVSGGGDPLFQYEKNVEWYRTLFKILDGIPLEMHTSYMTDETTFPFYNCKRVVYHPNSFSQLQHIHRTGNEKVRVVYVVTEDFTFETIMNIALFVSQSKDIDELSFRQLVKPDYETTDYWQDFLELGHEKLWYYIKQCDYNDYYAENKIYYRFSDIGKEVES